MRFEVSWSIDLDAANPVDAARQAWAMLDDATQRGVGATVLVARWSVNDYDREVMRLDMADEEPTVVG